MSESHILQITSLRDTVAKCWCERWHYAAITTSRDTDNELREQIEREFKTHVRYVVQKEEK